VGLPFSYPACSSAIEHETEQSTMQPLSKLIYITATEPEPGWEEEFNRWYDEEHIPNLRALPGYFSARRYIAVEGEPKYMAIYEIASMDAFRSAEHDRAANTEWTARMRPHFSSRGITFYEQVFPADGVLNGPAADAREGAFLTVRLDVAPEHEADFNAWYDQEHLAALATVPGVIAVRRFRATEGGPKYMAVYHLTDPAVQSSEAWARAIDTPWSARVRPTFTTRWRTVYKPLEKAAPVSPAG
jgi:antibiotic biosynthesis monooxygenase (ABM) superfamily enzyme